jgi:integrase/recombinase XerD
MDEQLKAFIHTLDTQQGYTESTRQAYAADLYQFFKFLEIYFGRKPKLTDFTLEVTKKFLEGERKAGMKPSTLHRRRVALKRFAQYLSDQNFLDSEVVMSVSQLQENLWKEISKQKVVCLNEKEVDRLMRTIQLENNPRALRDLAMFTLLFESGISIGILVSLNLSDINLRESGIRILENSHNDSWVFLPDSITKIKKYLEEGRPELTQSLSEEALFISQMGERITRQGVWQVLRTWGRQAKLRKTLSPRILRHTAVKQMLLENKTLGEIQQMLGHRNQFSTRALVRRIKKTCHVKSGE